MTAHGLGTAWVNLARVDSTVEGGTKAIAPPTIAFMKAFSRHFPLKTLASVSMARQWMKALFHAGQVPSSVYQRLSRLVTDEPATPPTPPSSVFRYGAGAVWESAFCSDRCVRSTGTMGPPHQLGSACPAGQRAARPRHPGGLMIASSSHLRQALSACSLARQAVHFVSTSTHSRFCRPSSN